MRPRRSASGARRKKKRPALPPMWKPAPPPVESRRSPDEQPSAFKFEMYMHAHGNAMKEINNSDTYCIDVIIKDPINDPNLN